MRSDTEGGEWGMVRDEKLGYGGRTLRRRSRRSMHEVESIRMKDMRRKDRTEEYEARNGEKEEGYEGEGV